MRRIPDVVGRTITVNGTAVTICGVSARGFEGANTGAVADITIAVAALAQIDPPRASNLGPGNFWLRALARPQKGVSAKQAAARLAVVWPQLSERVINPSWPEDRRKEMAESKFELTPGGTGYTVLRKTFGRPLMVLMAVTGLVLLIACANVACLLLARASARQREISVRLAIGAGRGRIIRQLLTESTLLSLFGATLGVGLAWLTSRFLVHILSGGALTVMFDLTPNWHVLGFTCAVAVGTGILFGLAPAMQIAAIGGAGAIKDDARMTGSRSRMLSALVSVQVALSFLLLVGAGLFVRTFENLLNVDPGFRREGVLLVNLDSQREGYRDARLTAFNEDLLGRVRRVPGVVSASISSNTPLSGSSWSEAAVPKGEPLPKQDNAEFIAAGPQFLKTMQTPMIEGRDFDEGDRGAEKVAIVNEAFVKQYFQGRNPVGEYLTATVTRPPSDLRIIGVVRNSATILLGLPAQPTVYVSYFQQPTGYDTLEIRAAGSISQVASAIRREVQPSFPDVPVEVRALTDQVERTLVQQRLMASLAGGFGALGLALACAGLYGLLAYGVVRRTKEIGVRIALGARRGEVAWMVARRMMWLVAAGLALGLPAAWGLTRLVQSMLFGLTATDARVMAAAVLLLAAAGAVAAYVPARRAAGVDPMTALRHE